MTPVASQKQVLEYNPSGAAAKAAPGAYPLAMPIYAATNPAQADAKTRADYATFIRFAATTGQQPGVDPGQLPPGYAPIPAAWKTQAIGAAAAIQSGVAAPDETSSGSGDLAPGTDAGDAGTTGDTGTGTAADAGTGSTPTTPAATGDEAGPLSDGKTPKDPSVGGIPAIVPGGLAGGLVAAASVPIIGRLRRFP
jgi:hypothetical protein